MGLELVFRSHPSSKERILTGVQEKSTVDELATLYGTTYAKLIAGNICLEMPSQAKVQALNVNSVELKNLFTQFAGKTICILDPDSGSLKHPSQTLQLP